MFSILKHGQRKISTSFSAWISRFNSTMARVCVSQGELEGTLETTVSGTEFSSFKGIPYATFLKRFQDPKPAQKWEGVKNASDHGPSCPQWDMTTGGMIEGDEDCLSLNVYTPNMNATTLPVMVWFHGGGFQSGSGDSFIQGPDYLVDDRVILVTVNYRLEVLGFLNLENKEVPGNAGIKDQVLALRWVQENISKFGGDPNNVTIFGESAGGACATYHLLSPMSKGLFHKVISQSGCFLNEWTIQHDCLERGFRLGQLFGIDTKNVDVLLSGLRSLPAMKLAKTSYPIATESEKFRGLPILFTPVVEKEFGQECFLSEAPEKLLKNKQFADVPILMGYNSGEGIVFMKEAIKRSKQIHNDFTKKVPKDIAAVASPELLKQLGENMRKFYVGDKLIGDESVHDKVIAMEGDYVFNYGVQKLARTMAYSAKSPVYFYKFSAESNLNFMKTISGYSEVKGASHADDLFYIFKTFVNIEPDSEEWKAVKRIVRLWTNFAKHSNPTPADDSLISVKWKPMTSTEANYLDIGFDLKPDVDPDKERYEFWTNMYQQVQDKNKSRL